MKFNINYNTLSFIAGSLLLRKSVLSFKAEKRQIYVTDNWGNDIVMPILK